MFCILYTIVKKPYQDSEMPSKGQCPEIFDTGGKFATGTVDTGGKLASGVIDT
jgi:hypothetical protein